MFSKFSILCITGGIGLLIGVAKVVFKCISKKGDGKKEKKMEENLKDLDTELVHTQPAIITKELLVSKKCVGRIIAKDRETIRTLCDTSGARIVAREDEDNRNFLLFNNQCESIICNVATFKKIIPRGLSIWKDAVRAFQTDFPVDWMIGGEEIHVTIMGTKEQVKAACSLLLEKINEEISSYQKELQTINSRPIRRKPNATRINSEDDRAQRNHTESLSLNNSNLEKCCDGIMVEASGWLTEETYLKQSVSVFNEKKAEAKGNLADQKTEQSAKMLPNAKTSRQGELALKSDQPKAKLNDSSKKGKSPEQCVDYADESQSRLGFELFECTAEVEEKIKRIVDFYLQNGGAIKELTDEEIELVVNVDPNELNYVNSDYFDDLQRRCQCRFAQILSLRWKREAGRLNKEIHQRKKKKKEDSSPAMTA